jgi:hypothetical protein
MSALGLVLRKWNPGPERHAEFVEDIRTLCIEAQVMFRKDQKDGNFVDGTGDLFLESCQATISKEAK